MLSMEVLTDIEHARTYAIIFLHKEGDTYSSYCTRDCDNCKLRYICYSLGEGEVLLLRTDNTEVFKNLTKNLTLSKMMDEHSWEQ
jgi:hypothetical protein